MCSREIEVKAEQANPDFILPTKLMMNAQFFFFISAVIWLLIGHCLSKLNIMPAFYK